MHKTLKRRSRELLGVAGILLAAASAAAGGSPGKPVKPAGKAAPAAPAQAGPNVKMNGSQAPRPDGALGRAAQSIAADRRGDRLVAGWETMQGICGGLFGVDCKPPKVPGISAYGYSTDGGRTWTEVGPPYLGDDVMTSGRPWLDRGGVDGETFFMTSRASSAKPAAAPAAAGMGQGRGQTPGGTGQLGVVIYRGRFDKAGAFAWDFQHLFTPARPNDLLRSPSVLAAKDGSGKVWVALSPLLEICGLKGGSGGQIEVWRSIDEAKTWQGPVVVSKDASTVTPDPNDPKCGATGVIQLSPSMALGPKGELYVVWEYGPSILKREPLELNHVAAIHFARSLDGGATFSEPKQVDEIYTMRDDVPAGYSKITINDFPRIAVAPGGPHRGRIYITYNGTVAPVAGSIDAQHLISSQVYLAWSDDQGTTWSKPAPLVPGELPLRGIKRFWPTVAVRDDGQVDIIYMEAQEKGLTPDPDDIECDIGTVFNVHRKGKAASLTDIYWVRSMDGGATFGAPVRVSSETTNWCKVKFDYSTTQFANFGDILGLFTTGARTFAVWPDGRDGVPDAYFAELGVGGPAKPKKPKK